jgi:hypothetical protein
MCGGPWAISLYSVEEVKVKRLFGRRVRGPEGLYRMG